MEKKMLDFSVKGLALDERDQMPVVILQNLERNLILPLFVGPFEASAIIIEIEGVRPPRPLTHDLFSELFQRHRFHLLSVEIYGKFNDEYLARLRYKTKVSVHTMEVRPSDGIALALRLNAPILVDERLLASIEDASRFLAGSEATADILYLETNKPGIQLM
jgi:bifunctional DNase/RNase